MTFAVLHTNFISGLKVEDFHYICILINAQTRTNRPLNTD